MFDIVNVAITRGAGVVARNLFPSRLQIQLLLIVATALAARCLAAVVSRLARR